MTPLPSPAVEALIEFCVSWAAHNEKYPGGERNDPLSLEEWRRFAAALSGQQEEIKRLREALAYYAAEKTYDSASYRGDDADINLDEGKKARAALGDSPAGPGPTKK